MACKCYHAERNFIGKIGVCWGTKECEACSCGGDESKCDFYDYVRERASSRTKHGRWVYAGFWGIVPVYKCSLCGNMESDYCAVLSHKVNYCSNCGAKMDGGQDDV